MVLETINRNTPLGAPKKNLATGNPYLDQLKEIDAEIKRLNKLTCKH